MKTFKELYEACCSACEKRDEIEEVKEPTGDLKDACWKGYTAVGMKMKNGRKVPNCVPVKEESDRNQRLRDALEKVKKDFTKSHADKKTTIKMPTPAPKPEPTSVDGGTDYYPKAPYGKRYMGDSVEMNGEVIDELSKGTLRRYTDDASDQVSDIDHSLRRTQKSKHLSQSSKDELKKLSDRRKKGIRLASDKRGYYKGSDAKANFTHGAAKVPATEETQKGKNVVPPHVGALATGGIVKEEENENKPLGKVMRAGDGKKKFKVFVKNSKGNTVKVGFGDPNMEIKRDDPDRRKNFRARHNCDTATDRTTPRYWSCRQWRSSAKVEA